MTPQGRPFKQAVAEELSKESELIILCGHYEGVDERVIEEIVTDEISIGDYVLTGGELAAMAIIDSVSRLIPGVLNKEESHQDETFSDNLLEYPQYTRPAEFMGRKVPDVLLSGNHGLVDKWRREKSIERTLKKRPELLDDADLTDKEREYLKRLRSE
jgi:tRNA (guanine37-N1)-methyltransferase